MWSSLAICSEPTIVSFRTLCGPSAGEMPRDRRGLDQLGRFEITVKTRLVPPSRSAKAGKSRDLGVVQRPDQAAIEQGGSATVSVTSSPARSRVTRTVVALAGRPWVEMIRISK